jgi:hypothetical protein
MLARPPVLDEMGAKAAVDNVIFNRDVIQYALNAKRPYNVLSVQVDNHGAKVILVLSGQTLLLLHVKSLTLG